MLKCFNYILPIYRSDRGVGVGGTAAADPLACKLQFNSLRYLGFALAKREAFHECLDCLEKAIRIDKSDVTLYFKLAVYAAKIGRYHMARSALEESLSYNQFNNSHATTSLEGTARTFGNSVTSPYLFLSLSLTFFIRIFCLSN